MEAGLGSLRIPPTNSRWWRVTSGVARLGDRGRTTIGSSPRVARQVPMETMRLLVDQYASAEAKIALFRSLFRGRDDVYPRRFESRKTGKSGYAPACSNEWVRGVCEKPRSNVRNAPAGGSSPSMKPSFDGTCPATTTPDSRLSRACIRCCSMKRASSLLSTLIRTDGLTMPEYSWTRAIA